ncbi:MliC family protein [Limimaricola cinnabarinus]|uniref:MliC family protein n=1 Tax=Limimaricola cinnabarinus TaxID=1125964 RepID=UPI0034E299B3
MTTTSYACGEDPSMQVRYVTSDSESLALVPIDSEQRVFVNVVAASGRVMSPGSTSGGSRVAAACSPTSSRRTRS